MLEEKRVPYRTELINMRSYGDKPDAFLAKVRGGILPALELDGNMYTESLDIMAMIDAVFDGDAYRTLLPARDSPAFAECQKLLRLERGLFSAWCSFVFRGGTGGQGQFERALGDVEKALGSTPGAWFLGDFTDGPSLVDLQCVERHAAAAAAAAAAPPAAPNSPTSRSGTCRTSSAWPRRRRTGKTTWCAAPPST
jgi:glutathione S-transferase